MIAWFKAWWKARGERLCAADHHSWKPCQPPYEKMGVGNTFAINMSISMLYSWARCRRCGKLGRRVAGD